MKIGDKVFVKGFPSIQMCIIAIEPQDKIVTCIAWTDTGWGAFPLPEDVLCHC